MRKRISNKSVEIDGRKIIRCDRKGRKNDRGGGEGVAIVVKKKLNCGIIATSNQMINFENIAFLILEIDLKIGKLGL